MTIGPLSFNTLNKVVKGHQNCTFNLFHFCSFIKKIKSNKHFNICIKHCSKRKLCPKIIFVIFYLTKWLNKVPYQTKYAKTTLRQFSTKGIFDQQNHRPSSGKVAVNRLDGLKHLAQVAAACLRR